MENHRKCSQCDVQVTQDNVRYKQFAQALELLFPTVAAGDDVNTAGQYSGPTNDESTSHIVITTLSGECTTLPYNPDQTILNLKDMVEQELKTPPNKQSLLYNDIELKVMCFSVSLISSNFSTTKKLTSCLMPVLQKTSIRFFKRFPTAKHSGKMNIRHLFRYGQFSYELFQKLFR